MGADARDVTDDAILNGRLRLLQPRRGHRFGHDAILLAAAVPAQEGEKVLELGAGVGAASLALPSRVPDTHVTLIRSIRRLRALASENIARNGIFGPGARRRARRGSGTGDIPAIRRNALHVRPCDDEPALQRCFAPALPRRDAAQGA